MCLGGAPTGRVGSEFGWCTASHGRELVVWARPGQARLSYGPIDFPELWITSLPGLAWSCSTAVSLELFFLNSFLSYVHYPQHFSLIKFSIIVWNMIIASWVFVGKTTQLIISLVRINSEKQNHYKLPRMRFIRVTWHFNVETDKAHFFSAYGIEPVVMEQVVGGKGWTWSEGKMKASLAHSISQLLTLCLWWPKPRGTGPLPYSHTLILPACWEDNTMKEGEIVMEQELSDSWCSWMQSESTDPPNHE